MERESFVRRLRAASRVSLDEAALDRLWLHFGELLRWNRRLSLVGPGTLESAVERHYAESLAVLSLLRPSDRVIIDLGSGAGFPGWVVAAARPDLQVTLVESRQKKWSFLAQVSQKAALPCQCLNARVTAALPEGFPQQMDLLLMRAVRPGEGALAALARRLSPQGRFLLWSGERPVERMEGLEPARTVEIEGSRNRRIIEWMQSDRGNRVD